MRWLKRKGRQNWLCLERHRGTVDVLPLNDSVEHETSDDCVCGPRIEPVEENGVMGWVVVHHSVDGREAREKK